MKKILYLLVAFMFITGCTSLKTPEINGVVVDAETKQPVEGAWVTATLEAVSKTIQGDVHQSLFVGKTWTDKEGKFVLPPKEYKKPSFLVSFGSKMESLNIAARTVTSKGYISDGIGIEEFEKEEQISLYLKPPKDAAYYLSAISGLYDYVLSGRLGVSVPAVPETEVLEVLDMAINAHEKYLEKYQHPKLIENPPYGVSKWDNIIAYSGALKRLAYLYKKRGNYNKALALFSNVKKFDLQHELSLSLKEYDVQINELQQKRLNEAK
jgi:hypothetical protein